MITTTTAIVAPLFALSKFNVDYYYYYFIIRLFSSLFSLLLFCKSGTHTHTCQIVWSESSQALRSYQPHQRELCAQQYGYECLTAWLPARTVGKIFIFRTWSHHHTHSLCLPLCWSSFSPSLSRSDSVGFIFMSTLCKQQTHHKQCLFSLLRLFHEFLTNDYISYFVLFFVNFISLRLLSPARTKTRTPASVARIFVQVFRCGATVNSRMTCRCSRCWLFGFCQFEKIRQFSRCIM